MVPWCVVCSCELAAAHSAQHRHSQPSGGGGARASQDRLLVKTDCCTVCSSVPLYTTSIGWTEGGRGEVKHDRRREIFRCSNFQFHISTINPNVLLFNVFLLMFFF